MSSIRPRVVQVHYLGFHQNSLRGVSYATSACCTRLCARIARLALGYGFAWCGGLSTNLLRANLEAAVEDFDLQVRVEACAGDVMEDALRVRVLSRAS